MKDMTGKGQGRENDMTIVESGVTEVMTKGRERGKPSWKEPGGM